MPTDLNGLKSGDFNVLKSAYESLKEDVFRICYPRLKSYFPHEIEDVVSEAAQDILEKVDGIQNEKALATVTKSIAENKAISCWRELTAKKRGAGKVGSIDKLREEGAEPYLTSDQNPGGQVEGPYSPTTNASDLSKLEVEDLRKILETLEADVKPDLIKAIRDSVVEGLSYAEISKKRGWPMGTVASNVSRGLKAMRDQRLKYPKLTDEAMLYIMLLL